VRRILQEESELNEIVRLVGFDALSEKDRLTFECARMIREDFLQQDSFREVDRFTPPKKQTEMIGAILKWYESGQRALKERAPYKEIMDEAVLTQIARMKYEPDSSWQSFIDDLYTSIDALFERLKGVDAE
ncbi:MAG: V-type ATP synthase subunit A, partial [Clostridia bacterium]|nr:V-type ATP synthase subunit A [Clostridia bacterium]